MNCVQPCPLPKEAALQAYCIPGTFTDCYSITLPGSISQVEFVTAFYTTPVFKIERLLLAVFASRPSTDADAANLAAGLADRFAAWSVEHRTADQLLLAAGPTRSWLMASQTKPGSTTLYFGSAVVPARTDRHGRPAIGWIFHALLGFHRLYSLILLGCAARRLRRP